MFTTPIRSTKLTTLEEVMTVSEYVIDPKRTYHVKVFCQDNGQIAFTNEHGNICVTPYRTEIRKILLENNYTEDTVSVPFSNRYEQVPPRYIWLKKMAEQENWSQTYEEAFDIAQKKGIKSVSLEFGSKQLRYREINSFYPDQSNFKGYHPMITLYLLNRSADNIGTYILVDDQVILVCDEYGRTFQITAHQKATFNSVVNTLIEAGYKHNVHPETFVTDLPKDFFEKKD